MKGGGKGGRWKSWSCWYELVEVKKRCDRMEEEAWLTCSWIWREGERKR